MATVMTWNILHGGGAKRMPEIVLSLVEHSADVIVLTEFRTTTGGQIRGVLGDHGWVHQATSNPGPRQNGLLVASRSELAAVKSLHKTPKPAHRWLEVSIPALGVIVAGVHVPESGKSDGMIRYLADLVDHARRRVEEPLLIIGDLNTGRHLLDEEGRSFACTSRLGELATLGYRDAWRLSHPGEREFSWYSHTGNGFRIDHALASPALAPRVGRAWYSHAEREQGVSDHSMLAVEFESVSAEAR